jgi:hypothetical protein
LNLHPRLIMCTVYEVDLLHYSMLNNGRFINRIMIFHKIKIPQIVDSNLHPRLILRTVDEVDLLHCSVLKNERFINRILIFHKIKIP